MDTKDSTKGLLDDYPTPWSINECGDILDANGHIISDPSVGISTTPVIVKVASSHASLLAALEEIRLMAENNPLINMTLIEIQRVARKAIKEARA